MGVILTSETRDERIKSSLPQRDTSYISMVEKMLESTMEFTKIVVTLV